MNDDATISSPPPAGDSTPLPPTVDALKKPRNYEVGATHACGGMGAILCAKDLNINRTVAMKVMLGDRADATERLLRFVDEAKITGQLEHPNIVPIYELGVDEQNRPFYTMKFVMGVTLKQVLDEIKQAKPETIARYSLAHLLTVFQKICDAVAFAHARGVVHRDLKPENVMLGEYGEVLVLDWGLAKVLRTGEQQRMGERANEGVGEIADAPIHPLAHSTLTMSGTIMGSPNFMAPEQAAGQVDQIDARTDIYTLGGILYNILALEPPIKGETKDEALAHARDGAIGPLADTSLAAHCPRGQVPTSLVAVVRKALAKARKDRYQTVKELQDDVAAYQHGFATLAEHAGVWKRVVLLIRRNQRVSITVATLTFIFGLVFFGHAVQDQQVRRKRYSALVQAARDCQTRQEWDEAIVLLTKANLLIEKPEDRSWLARLLVESARHDLDSQSWAAAGIKLQRALNLVPDNAAALALMPLALGDGFLSVEARCGGELIEFFYDAQLQRLPGKEKRYGALPVHNLRLASGYHYFEIWQDNRRLVSLPVSVMRGERQTLRLDFAAVPDTYEYIHEGEFIMGDDSTEQADGSIGRRRKLIGSFFMKRAPVTIPEYLRFWNSAEYERLLGQVLAEHHLVPSQLVDGAKTARDITPYRWEETKFVGNVRRVVLGIGYYEALAYAAWAGARLPSEAEWEKAVRGIDGRLFTAGVPSEIGPDKLGLLEVVPSLFSRTPYGCDDLARVCLQWTTDADPAQPGRRIVKGSPSVTSLLEQKPARRRSLDAATKYHTVGFVLCKDLPQENRP